MGLDSVELLIEFEKYFNIRIENKIAETIRTVQDTTNVIAGYLGIEEEGLSLKDEIFLKIQQAFYKIYNVSFTYSDLVSKYLHREDTEWDHLRKETGFRIPQPEKVKTAKGPLRYILRRSSWSPLYNWLEVTFEDFTETIYAANIETLVDVKKLKSKYEVYICVKAITARCLGLEFYEITPEKSFTDDLGVD